MLVVLLTAALLALSSAQSADEDVQSISDVQSEPAPVDQTQDSSSDPSSTDANTVNVQEAESAPAGNESSANSGSGQEQQQQAQESQQAKGQGPSDSSVKEQESQSGEEKVEEVKKELPFSPEKSEDLPQHILPKKNHPNFQVGSEHYEAIRMNIIISVILKNI
ncbi:submandibular gland secretory Glx-rich protein CB-like [Mus caroli]|uniref:Submandibular gland secretory Glx-rich protein CB-like n=1 Tax=Mus caroli TaxID=10089 RepID=A0A6P5P9Z2_MUSCR|nr:submandibular gland secretory Glx-rich protein CB-like [Mus caroli]